MCDLGVGEVGLSDKIWRSIFGKLSFMVNMGIN